jgi:hypothetical protein
MKYTVFFKGTLKLDDLKFNETKGLSGSGLASCPVYHLSSTLHRAERISVSSAPWRR